MNNTYLKILYYLVYLVAILIFVFSKKQREKFVERCYKVKKDMEEYAPVYVQKEKAKEREPKARHYLGAGIIGAIVGFISGLNKHYK